MRPTRGVLLVIAMATFLFGCSNMQVRSASGTAKLAPTRGNQVSGEVSFQQKGDVVMVVARVTGLTPGLHGFHVHEKGDCSAPDGSSAGGHFNPSGNVHGPASGKERHAGDLGNLLADNSGVASYRAEISGISLGTTGSDSIIGRAIVVHASVDDLFSQPSGSSGERVACGLISLSPDKWFHQPQ